MQNLHNGITVVKGIIMMVFEEFLAKVTRLLEEGVKWTNKLVLLYNAIEVFQDLGEWLVQARK